MAWAFYDFANSSFATVIQTFVFASYFTQQVAQDESEAQTQWSLALGLAGLLVAFGGPLLGAVADRGGRRKPWIAAFTALPIAATAGMWFVEPETGDTLLALVLLAVGTVGAQWAFVFYNAMLPDLAPSGRVGRWSGWGWALGYVGGLACLVLALFAFVRPEGAWLGLDSQRAEHIRATFIMVSVWYLLFTLPLLIFTPDRSRSQLPMGQAVREGLAQLVRTIRQARSYTDILRFLAAWLLISDGMAAIFALGGVFAAGAFGMSPTRMLAFGIALNVSAGLGAFAAAWIDDRIGPRRTMLLSLVGIGLPGVAMLLVQQEFWFWVCGLTLGLFVGPVQASSRSLMARRAPAELRAQMFGLYALAGKATAFIAPLLVSAVTAATGNQRIGLSVIFFYIGLGFLIMLSVKRDRTAPNYTDT